MKHREFIYVGDPIPEISEKSNADFLLLYQKAVLSSLKSRNLIDQLQYKRCVEKLENLYIKIRGQA